MTTINSDRRRSVLRSVADLFVRWREECETAALHLGRARARGIMRLSDEAKTLGEEVLLAAMPSGAVGFIEGDPSQVTLERDGLTITMPVDTPDEVVKWLFRMAGPATGRHTLASLAQAHEDRDERLLDVLGGLRRRGLDLRSQAVALSSSQARARQNGKAVAYEHAAELVTSACDS